MLRRPQVPANFRIHISRKSFLLSASHYVSANFRWYTAGQVPASKAERLVAKFDRAYGILDNKREFDNKRRRGAARSRLLMLLPDHEGIKVTTDTPVDFILLSSDGTGAVHELENLIRIQSGSPLRYGNLVYRNNGGMKGGGKQKSHWSWFFNQQFYQDMREMSLHAARMRDLKRASNLVGQLMIYPPFHGIRVQRAAVFRSMRKTAIHAGHSQQSLDFIPEKQFWVRKGQNNVKPLFALLG